MTEQGYPPGQPEYPGRQGRLRAPHQPRKTGWQVLDAFDDVADSESDLPPWAVPGGIEPLRPARRPPRPAAVPPAPDLDRYGEPAEFGDSAEHAVTRPGGPRRIARKAGRSRAAAARRRRSKRRLVTWGGTAVVVAVLVAGGLWLTRSHAPKSPWVRTFQKGEFRTAPDACKIVGATELQALLKGTPKSVQPYKGSTSQCTYTVDAKPVFRVLSLTVQVYPASLTAPGNGSATANARYAFAAQRTKWAKPAKGTPEPPAKITAIAGLGSEALRAMQVFRNGRITNEVTVLVRYRNVLIQASFQGVTSGGFGPVTTHELGAGAESVARAAFAAVKAEPTVG